MADDDWKAKWAKVIVPPLVSALLGAAGGAAIAKKLIKLSHAGYYIAAASYEDFGPDTAWVPSNRSAGWQQASKPQKFQPAIDCDHPIIQTAISAFDLHQHPGTATHGDAASSVKVAAVVDANTNGNEPTRFGFPLYVQTDGPNVSWVNVHWFALCPLTERSE